MAYPTVAWSEAAPAGTDYIRDGDNRIRELKVQLREIIDVDHVISSSGSGDTWGNHNQVTLIEAADIGSGAEGIPILGAQTVTKPELCYTDEDDNDVILTDEGKIALQNGRLPNDSYLIGRNNADDGDVNILKVNTSDEVEVGADLVVGGTITPTGNILPNALLLEETTAPTTAENFGALYTKNDGDQTELYFREESDGDEVQITNAGVLANTLDLTLSDIEDYATSTSSSTSKNQKDLKVCYGNLTADGSGVAVTNLPFTSSSSYRVFTNFASNSENYETGVVKNSGSQFTVYKSQGTSNVDWIAIGV